MKNLPKIQVLELHADESAETVIQDASQIHTTGDANVTAPPVTDTVMAGLITTLQTRVTGSKASPPTFTVGQVTTSKNIVITSYNKIARYVEGVANDVAIAAGDVTAGNTVVTRVGCRLKKKSTRGTKKFSATSKIDGEIEVGTKAPGAHTIYVRQYGKTTAKGVTPAVISDTIISGQSNISITNLTSGTIYGVREALILPIPNKKRGGIISSATTATARGTTPVATTKTNKATYADGATHYVYSDWIYITVK
jgi:hypothetical protein